MKTAELEWKNLCYNEKNGDCCYLLADFYRTDWASGPIGKYSLKNSLKTFTDCCANLQWASCCKSAADVFLYNSLQAPNLYSGKRSMLFGLEALRLSCLEADYSHVGGERPTDFKSMDLAGQACDDLYKMVDSLRNRDVLNLVSEKEHVTFSQKSLVETLEAEHQELLNKTNPSPMTKTNLKPDLPKIKEMIQTLPITTIINKGCQFQNGNMCMKKFQGQMKGVFGFDKNVDEAYDAGEISCKKNNPKACFNLWKMYENGIGRPPNMYKADVYRSFYEEISGINARKQRMHKDRSRGKVQMAGREEIKFK